MAFASGLQFRFEWARLPLLEGALELARQGSVPGGTARNRDFLQNKVLILREGLTDEQDAVLFDPQTSGGLLMAVPAQKYDQLRHEFQRRGVSFWEVGHVTEGQGIAVI
jgi:selenide, water dikinase